MKKILVLVVAVGLLSGGAGVAWAATTGDSTGGSVSTSAQLAAASNGRHGGRFARLAVQVAADTLHVDRTALVQELRSGKTIADVARDHHVDPQTVIDAIVNAAKQKLSGLESSGKINGARLQQLEQRLPTAVEKLVNRKFDGRLGSQGGGARAWQTAPAA